MKVVVVGGTGTVGSAIVSELSARHSVVVVGHTSGEVTVDVADVASIEKMYQQINGFDALISAAGNVHFGELAELTTEQVNVGLQSKLMGQVNLVLLGLKHINHKGSFTLTSGVLSQDPIVMGACAAMVNGAIDSFVKSAAIEVQNNIRINAVSPTILTESMPRLGSYFRGFESVPASRVALAYSKTVEGAQTGQVYQVI